MEDSPAEREFSETHAAFRVTLARFLHSRESCDMGRRLAASFTIQEPEN